MKLFAKVATNSNSNQLVSLTKKLPKETSDSAVFTVYLDDDTPMWRRAHCAVKALNVLTGKNTRTDYYHCR